MRRHICQKHFNGYRELQRALVNRNGPHHLHAAVAPSQQYSFAPYANFRMPSVPMQIPFWQAMDGFRLSGVQTPATVNYDLPTAYSWAPPNPALFHSLSSRANLSGSKPAPLLFFPRCKLPTVPQATTSNPLPVMAFKGYQTSRSPVHLTRSRPVSSRLWRLPWSFRGSSILCNPLRPTTPWSRSRTKCFHVLFRARRRGDLRYTGVVFSHGLTVIRRSRSGCARSTYPSSTAEGYRFACTTQHAPHRPNPGSAQLYCPPSVAGNNLFAHATERPACRPTPGNARLHYSPSVAGNHSFACATERIARRSRT